MIEFIGVLLWQLAELALVITGKFIIFAASLGRWRGEHLNSDESLIYAPAGALSFKRDGQRVVTASGLALAGVAFYALLGLVLVWLAS